MIARLATPRFARPRRAHPRRVRAATHNALAPCPLAETPRGWPPLLAQVQGLEAGKKEAEEFLHTERQLNEKKSALYHKNMLVSKTFAAEREEERGELAAKLAEEKAKASEREKEMSKLEKEYNKARKEADKSKELVEKTRKEFQAFEREDIKQREELKHGKSQLKKLQVARHARAEAGAGGGGERASSVAPAS